MKNYWVTGRVKAFKPGVTGQQLQKSCLKGMTRKLTLLYLV
jgi:hypothetical protein